MSYSPEILVFAGSTREGALSGQLAKAVALEIDAQGATANLVTLKDYPAAIYNGDDEDAEGVPQSIKDLTALIRSHDGMIIATPEYNGFFTPLIKNTLDWCSRPGASNETPPLPRGKPVAIVSSAPGALGGIRAIPRLRDYLSELGFLVSPDIQPVSRAGEAFGEDGRLKEEKAAKQLTGVVATLLRLASAAGETG